MAVRATTEDLENEYPLHYLTEEEAIALFDEVVQDFMNMSGEEFLERWDAGEYAGMEDAERIRTVVGFLGLIPGRKFM